MRYALLVGVDRVLRLRESATTSVTGSKPGRLGGTPLARRRFRSRPRDALPLRLVGNGAKTLETVCIPLPPNTSDPRHGTNPVSMCETLGTTSDPTPCLINAGLALSPPQRVLRCGPRSCSEAPRGRSLPRADTRRSRRLPRSTRPRTLGGTDRTDFREKDDV